MLMDLEVTLSNNQTIAAAVGTIVSSNVIDLGVPNANGPAFLAGSAGLPIKDLGRGAGVVLLCQITEAVLSAGAATVQFQLVTATDAAISTSIVVHQDTGAIGKAALVNGYQVPLSVPTGITQRYLAMRYIIAGATTTAGRVTAGFVVDKQSNY